MNVLAASVTVMAGITFYAGFYQLLIYGRRRENRVDLTLALTCLAMGLYDVFCAGVYSSHSVAESVSWQRAQYLALNLVGLSFVYFIADYTALVSKRLVSFFTIYFILAIAVVGIDRTSLTWDIASPSIKNIMFPFLGQVSIYEASPGPFTMFQNVAVLFVGGYMFWSGVVLYRHKRQKRARLMLLAMLVFAVGVINDAAVSGGLYVSIYLVEYAYIGILFLMTYSLSGEVMEAVVVRDALRESEAKFRSIVEASPMGMHMYRLEEDGRLIFTGANPAADATLGIDHQVFVGKTLEEAFPPLAGTEAADRYRRACAKGESWSAEQIDYADERIRGAYEVHAFQTKPGAMVVMFLDITHRKQIEEGLRHERDLVSQVMETSPAGIVVMDREGQITFANAQAELVLGLSRAEISQRVYNTPEWHITGYEGEPFLEEDLPFVRVMSTAKPVFGIRHAIEWPDGRRVLLSINTAPLLDSKGQVDGMVSTVEDVTSRVQTEQEREVRIRRVQKQQITLVQLAMHPAVVSGDFDRAAQTITQVMAATIEVERASLWLFAKDSKMLECVDLFEQTSGRHSRGVSLNMTDYPRYFEAFLAGRVIDAHDAALDPRTSEFTTGYLASGEIVSMLDAVVRVRGQAVGIVCYEQVGAPRWWQSDEIAFAGAVADQAALAFLNRERKQIEHDLRQYTERLKVLREIDQDILAAQSPQAIAEAVLKYVQHLLPCQSASVTLFDFDADQVEAIAVLVQGQTQSGSGRVFTLEEFGVDERLALQQVVVEPNLQNLASLSPVRGILSAEGIRSVMHAPLVVQGRLFGSLNLGAREPDVFMDVHVEVARELADVLAVAIQQARLHEQVQRHTDELEERVHQRTAALESKNRELQTFTYSVSHDLKTPLRGIDGYSSLLLEDHAAQLDEEGRVFLTSIRNGVRFMGQLIDDLLAYSRLEQQSLNKEQVYIPTLVSIALAEREAEINSRRVKLTVDVKCTYVLAEREGLLQAVRNLLDNALKFTRDIPDPCIWINGWETEKQSILWVKDNGIGFDMQYHDRIFELFQRLHRAEDYPGTGIGLTLVRKAVQRIGGRVWAESASGAGATFYLEIPR